MEHRVGKEKRQVRWRSGEGKVINGLECYAKKFGGHP